MTGKREILVILSGAVIAAACFWRIAVPRDTAGSSSAVVVEKRPAPSFELYDQQSRLVKLDAYLHRHDIVLVFFDGSRSPEDQLVLTQLREFYPALQSSGIVALGISNALPQVIRQQSQKPFPFPIVSDVTAGQPGSASQIWGCVERMPLPESPGAAPDDLRPVIRDSVFFIDRGGLVGWDGDHPRPLDRPQDLVSALISGRRPL